MIRVAVVTGGTRGIGHAISIALKHKGCRVAANYAGNDAAARQFQAETGIPVYKFDVGDFDACQQGVTRITRDLGPIDILVNNAGITRDAVLHRMSKDNWDAVIRTNLDSVFNMTRLVIEGMRARSYGRIIARVVRRDAAALVLERNRDRLPDAPRASRHHRNPNHGPFPLRLLEGVTLREIPGRANPGRGSC